LLSFLWNDQVLPRSNHRLRTLQVDIQRKKPSFTLKEQVINEVVPGQFFLRAARIDPNSNKLKDVTIYDLGDAERRRIIGADSAASSWCTPHRRPTWPTRRRLACTATRCGGRRRGSGRRRPRRRRPRPVLSGHTPNRSAPPSTRRSARRGCLPPRRSPRRKAGRP